jgi:hypothetical protein
LQEQIGDHDQQYANESGQVEQIEVHSFCHASQDDQIQLEGTE